MVPYTKKTKILTLRKKIIKNNVNLPENKNSEDICMYYTIISN